MMVNNYFFSSQLINISFLSLFLFLFFFSFFFPFSPLPSPLLQGKVRDLFHFPANNLYITSIDIQSAEPVDQRTRDALQKSVQLAIEITTNSQEASARHKAERLEQEAKGRLERQRIEDEAAAEEARKMLLELQAHSAAVESTGQAKAEATSRAEAAKIEGEAAVEQARLKSMASKIEAESELERLTAARDAEGKYIKEQNELEIAKTREMMEIDSSKVLYLFCLFIYLFVCLFYVFIRRLID